jgi:hypothetical protein
MVEQAERISIELLQLEHAVGRGDPVHASDSRQRLRSIAAEWLDHRIKH